MQNKGALKFLAIALAVACAYQLSFTFVTRHVENKAAQYAAGDAVKEQNYLDSIKSQTVYNLGFIKFNYKQCKEKEINLGLDLRGGMNVMLEISVEDVVRALSNDMDLAFPALKDDARFQRHASQFRATLNDALSSPPADCAALAVSLQKLGDDCKACHQDFR